MGVFFWGGERVTAERERENNHRDYVVEITSHCAPGAGCALLLLLLVPAPHDVVDGHWTLPVCGGAIGGGGNSGLDTGFFRDHKNIKALGKIIFYFQRANRALKGEKLFLLKKGEKLPDQLTFSKKRVHSRQHLALPGPKKLKSCIQVKRIEGAGQPP